MLALYTGELREDVLWEMSYQLYSDLLEELAIMLNYQSTTPIAGNAMASAEALALVQEANPFRLQKAGKKQNKKLTVKDLAQMNMLK